jgi:F-type H+-transporting ATPase subunit a
MANAFEHVKDSTDWHIFDRLFGGVHIPLPNILGLQLTKFMVLEVLIAILLIAIFVPLCRRSQSGEMPKGTWWNAFESLLTFIRDQVAKPAIGEHDADKYVPLLWTMFLFVLFCNLMGMIPFMGSPTASIWVTGGMAVCSFVVMHGAASVKMGGIKYLKSLWPHLGLGIPGRPIEFLVCFLEAFGTVIKSFVLAVRLFANMFAGHMVLATILLFIVSVGNAGFSLLWPVVTVSSVLGVVALSLLELFVAFLQAYIFTFLTALFMGMALHPAH